MKAIGNKAEKMDMVYFIIQMVVNNMRANGKIMKNMDVERITFV
jgi:hypothetical protein